MCELVFVTTEKLTFQPLKMNFALLVVNPLLISLVLLLLFYAACDHRIIPLFVSFIFVQEKLVKDIC